MDLYNDPLSVDADCVSFDLDCAGWALRPLLFVGGSMASSFIK